MRGEYVIAASQTMYLDASFVENCRVCKYRESLGSERSQESVQDFAVLVSIGRRNTGSYLSTSRIFESVKRRSTTGAMSIKFAGLLMSALLFKVSSITAKTTFLPEESLKNHRRK